MNVIIGYVKGVSKKTNKPYGILYYATDFSDRRVESGACGKFGNECFLPDSFDLNQLGAGCIGKKCAVTTEVVRDKVYVTDVAIYE